MSAVVGKTGNRYRLFASWWRLALLFGTPSGLLFSLFVWWDDPETFGGATDLLTIVLLFGIWTGWTMGLVVACAIRRTTREATAVTGVNDHGEVAAAGRAAAGGPVPTDPRLRAAARNLAIHQLDVLEGKRAVTVAVTGLCTLACAVAAIFLWSPTWVLLAMVNVGFLASRWTVAARLKRRIDLLADPSGLP